MAKRYPYVIISTTAWDYKTLQAHRHIIGDASYHTSGMKAALANKGLEGYIRELGYSAIRGATIPQTVPQMTPPAIATIRKITIWFVRSQKRSRPARNEENTVSRFQHVLLPIR